MKRIVLGMLAHVDAGKTTLSEAMLYQSGSIRKMGRVDHGDAFLDTNALERARGITIFSKQAIFTLPNMQVTLLDTPGHIDFSPEMERTLQVLDYAVLVVSGADGVQGHTKTLWSLLKKYNIPVFVFINKMDQEGTEKEKLLAQIKSELHDGCLDFGVQMAEDFYEEIAMADEHVLEYFLQHGKVETESIRELIHQRKIFPCYFGSALKKQGVKLFLQGISEYAKVPAFSAEFGAKVFKIARDETGSRLTYLKVTGGSLAVKMLLEKDDWKEKVNQIRLYSGGKYETVSETPAGTVCAVTGLTKTRPGEGLGAEQDSSVPVLEPVLTYRIQLPDGMDAAQMLPRLRELEEEEPQLHIVWNETLQEIHAQIMGEVQIEILRSLIAKRFGIEVQFDTGKIVYKETIHHAVTGVGHFEPLRHYAEVHLLLEPGEPGSGLQFGTSCSEDMLNRNWQRLVLTHLEEKAHRGVLTNAMITDMRITLIAGRAHQKHTEGGDFRQATYRAVRQGLKQAESVLLEPYYEFRLEVLEQLVGRAMTDIDQMFGKCQPPQIENGLAILIGSAPVSTMREYAKTVTAYTKGHGRLFCSLKGYEPCHNQDEVIAAVGYDSERDADNPTGSVFCAHGAGFVVGWDEVKSYMHAESPLSLPKRSDKVLSVTKASVSKEWVGTEEIDAILEKTFHANKRDKSKGSGNQWNKTKAPQVRTYKGTESPQWEEFLLVDGYNVIFAWEDLKELAEETIDGARGKLLDILCDYQAIRKCNLIVVFDAYRIIGHPTEILDYHNIHVVFTKEAETADQYIEKFAHENGRKYRVTVATSDGLEQMIIRGQGCLLLSARELLDEITRAKENLKNEYMDNRISGKNYLLESLKEETVEQLKNLSK